MKRLLSLLLCTTLILSFGITVLADGDPNIDGGGGGVGDGDLDGGSYWNVGDDGVRVTVVKEKSRTSVTSPIDFCNKTQTIDFYFGLKSKLQYGGGSVSPQVGSSYVALKADVAIPQVVSSGGGNNIAAVKEYFKTEGTIKDVAQKTGFEYKKLINGDYVLLLEPIIYFRYKGLKFAATATEVALYDQVTNGDVKAKLGFATHQNLPLAMFLELPQLGYPAYSGATSGIMDDSTIISQLGLGIVNFKEQACCAHAANCPCLGGKPDGPDCACKKDHPDVPCDPSNPKCKCKPTVSTWDYEYRTDTDVITAVRIRAGGEINPDDDASVTFFADGKTYSKSYVIPAGESQLVWFKWHTPKTPQVVNVTVSPTAGSAEKMTIVCNVVKLEEQTPPNPQGRDRNDGFRPKIAPSYPTKTAATWGEWYAYWVPNWVWISHSCDDEECDEEGYWEDQGWWEFEWLSYSARLVSTLKLTPDEKVPTAISRYNSFEIKSGYGYNIEVTASVSSSRDYDVTPIQNVVTLFPEFGYKTYDRLLEPKQTGYYSVWEFFQNKYSMTKQRVHFTPIWYPDGGYQTYMICFDAWTPDGMLAAQDTFDFEIDGDVYKDWFISPIA